MTQNYIKIKEVNDYIEFAEKNPDEISDDVKLLIENVAKPTLKRDDVFFDSETYYKAIEFVEKWFYGLYAWQKFILAFMFMYEEDNHDIVIFKDIFLLIGRGNGKSGFIAPIALFMLTPAYGVEGYNIDIVATSENQAQNTYNVAYNMLESNKEIMKKHFYWNKTHIIGNQTNSVMRYNTANASTKDGKQSGMIVFDELHSYGDYKQINTFTSGLGKVPHARVFTTTTNGSMRDGPLDEKINLSNQVLNGEFNFLDVFPVLFRIVNKEDIDKPMATFLETNDKKDIDVTEWVKANPSLRAMSTLETVLIGDYLKVKSQPSYKVEFYMKRMNVPMEDEKEVITSWDNILKASYGDVSKKTPRFTPELNGRTAVVGIDFASIRDFLSAGFLFKIGDEYVWRGHTWICSNSPYFKEIKFPFDNKGNAGFNDFTVVHTETIDENEMINWLMNEMPKYNIKKLVMDNYRFKLLKKSFQDRGLDAETKQNPNGLIQMLRNPTATYAVVAPMIEREFIEGNINIGDSAITRWSIQNTGMKQLSSGNYTYFKVEPKLRKNDSFMAMVHAFAMTELLQEQKSYAYV